MVYLFAGVPLAAGIRGTIVEAGTGRQRTGLRSSPHRVDAAPVSCAVLPPTSPIKPP
jgi:hypothetical protein